MMRTISLFLLTSLATGPLSNPSAAIAQPAAVRPRPDGAPATARATLDAYHAAIAARDTAAAERLLSPDVVVYEFGRGQYGLATFITEHLGPELARPNPLTRTLLRREDRADRDLAWAAIQWRLAGTTVSGRRVDSRITETDILKRVGGRWLIVHIHLSSSKND